MFWIIPVAVGVVVTLVAALESQAGRERARFHTARRRVERELSWHREQIEAHLSDARASYDFHLLAGLHHSSVQVADQAYRLLTDARRALAALGATLVEARERRDELKKQRKAARSKRRRAELGAEIAGLYKLRAALFADKDQLKAERDHLMSEVLRLNDQTRLLKEAIRDRCGHGGRIWYERLEARRLARRSAA